MLVPENIFSTPMKAQFCNPTSQERYPSRTAILTVLPVHGTLYPNLLDLPKPSFLLKLL